jgi:hypothetical protein
LLQFHGTRLASAVRIRLSCFPPTFAILPPDDQARVVHVLRSDRQREGEAEYDDEGDEVGATDGVGDVADNSFHPKVVWLRVFSSA